MIQHIDNTRQYPIPRGACFVFKVCHDSIYMDVQVGETTQRMQIDRAQSELNKAVIHGKKSEHQGRRSKGVFVLRYRWNLHRPAPVASLKMANT